MVVIRTHAPIGTRVAAGRGADVKDGVGEASGAADHRHGSVPVNVNVAAVGS